MNKIKYYSLLEIQLLCGERSQKAIFALRPNLRSSCTHTVRTGEDIRCESCSFGVVGSHQVERKFTEQA